PASVQRVEDHLGKLLAVSGDLADRLPELLHGQAEVERKQALSPYFVRAQAPQILGLRVPGLDVEIGVEDDDAGSHVRENRLEEDVRLVQLRRPVAELGVDRLELLVRRLQLLVHRLELLRSEERRVGKECRSRWWRS